MPALSTVQDPIPDTPPTVSPQFANVADSDGLARVVFGEEFSVVSAGASKRGSAKAMRDRTVVSCGAETTNPAPVTTTVVPATPADGDRFNEAVAGKAACEWATRPTTPTPRVAAPTQILRRIMVRAGDGQLDRKASDRRAPLVRSTCRPVLSD
jgi:hypothetical protein